MSARHAPAEGSLRAGDTTPVRSGHRVTTAMPCGALGACEHPNPASDVPAVGATVMCTRRADHAGQHEAAGVSTILATWTTS